VLKIINSKCVWIVFVSWSIGFLFFGCGSSGDNSYGPDGGQDGGLDGGLEQGPLGFIGGPCKDDSDCDYEGGICLTQGFEGGLCSLACASMCPDREGHPVTFCVAPDELASSLGELAEGKCVSRCHLGIFSDSGCREGYGCVAVERYNQPETQKYACLPGRESELAECYLELAARGVSFEPTVFADESPSTHPELTCHIEDPVVIFSPLHGVDLRYPDQMTSSVFGACEMAHALTSTIDDLKEHGVTAFEHYEAYTCRVIAGTDKLSRHGHGDAIDIFGVWLNDEAYYTLVDDWEHDTESPQSLGGKFLYEAAYRWHENNIWNIILTPDYNDAHDDHFHVDLTPDTHVIH
jgi:hypothetical protein